MPNNPYEAYVIGVSVGVVPALDKVRKIFIMAKTFTFTGMFSIYSNMSFSEEEMANFEKEYNENEYNEKEWSDLDNEDKAEYIMYSNHPIMKTGQDYEYQDDGISSMDHEWSE